MPKNQVSDPITDQEIAFALLILSGTMTDRRAAEAIGLNPDTAAYTKAKPRVRTYMHEHQAAVRERLVQQETEEVRRKNQTREQVLARLWQIANLSPEITRNSASAQMKALSMIVAIEGLIPSGSNDRRPPSAQNTAPGADWLSEQQTNTAVPHPAPGAVADAPSDLGPTSSSDLVSGEPIVAHPSSPTETTPSSPLACVPASAPDTRVPSSIAKKPDTWRLRL
jgi:hypothetical protein